MGRPMLIIIAGILVAIGIRQLGLLGTLGSMDQRSITYAESVQAKNNAYSGMELALQEILVALDEGDDLNPTYQYSFGENITTINISEEVERVNLRAVGTFNDELQGIRMILKKGYTINIPDYIEAAVAIDIENFELTMGTGAEFIGEDKMGVCEDKDDLAIPDIKATCKNLNPLAGLLCSLLGAAKNLVSTLLGPGVGSIVENTIDLIPLVEFTHNLENTLGTQPLTGEIIGDLGSPGNPGVFMVEGGQQGVAGSVLQLFGGNGYGIMIIHQPDHAEIETALLLTENYTFHGLVIIDNVSDITLDNIRLPNINGSLLITNSNPTIGIGTVEIEIPDHTVIQYDCGAWKYVERAIGPQIISVYEEGRIAA